MSMQELVAASVKAAYKTKTANETASTEVFREFGVRDRKGRMIGARVFLRELDMVELTDVKDGYYGYNTVEPGHYFVMTVCATRGGASYGASQPRQYFTTAEAREAAMETYFAGAAKRAKQREGK
jgi:hypothetical protein